MNVWFLPVVRRVFNFLSEQYEAAQAPYYGHPRFYSRSKSTSPKIVDLGPSDDDGDEGFCLPYNEETFFALQDQRVRSSQGAVPEIWQWQPRNQEERAGAEEAALPLLNKSAPMSPPPINLIQRTNHRINPTKERVARTTKARAKPNPSLSAPCSLPKNQNGWAKMPAGPQSLKPSSIQVSQRRKKTISSIS